MQNAGQLFLSSKLHVRITNISTKQPLSLPISFVSPVLDQCILGDFNAPIEAFSSPKRTSSSSKQENCFSFWGVIFAFQDPDPLRPNCIRIQDSIGQIRNTSKLCTIQDPKSEEDSVGQRFSTRTLYLARPTTRLSARAWLAADCNTLGGGKTGYGK